MWCLQLGYYPLGSDNTLNPLMKLVARLSVSCGLFNGLWSFSSVYFVYFLFSDCSKDHLSPVLKFTISCNQPQALPALTLIGRAGAVLAVDKAEKVCWLCPRGRGRQLTARASCLVASQQMGSTLDWMLWGKKNSHMVKIIRGYCFFLLKKQCLTEERKQNILSKSCYWSYS